MKSFYGFTKPYDFNRAFPFATATFFLLLTIGVMVSAALFGRTWLGHLPVLVLFVCWVDCADSRSVEFHT